MKKGERHNKPVEGLEPSKTPTYHPNHENSLYPRKQKRDDKPRTVRQEYIIKRDFLISAGRIEDEERDTFLALAEEAGCGQEARRLLRALFIWEQGRKLKAVRGLPTDGKPFAFEVTENMEGQ